MKLLAGCGRERGAREIRRKEGEAPFEPGLAALPRPVTSIPTVFV
jgi:hypothetical protein